MLNLLLRSTLIEFSSRAIIRIRMPSVKFLRIGLPRAGVHGFGVQVDPYIFLDGPLSGFF